MYEKRSFHLQDIILYTTIVRSGCDEALAKNPTDRFDSISEMMGDLRLSQGFTMGKKHNVMNHTILRHK